MENSVYPSKKIFFLKPFDLDPHCVQSRKIPGPARQGLSTYAKLCKDHKSIVWWQIKQRRRSLKQYSQLFLHFVHTRTKYARFLNLSPRIIKIRLDMESCEFSIKFYKKAIDVNNNAFYFLHLFCFFCIINVVLL